MRGKINVGQKAENALKEAAEHFGDIEDYPRREAFKAGYAIGFLHGAEDTLARIKEVHDGKPA